VDVIPAHKAQVDESRLRRDIEALGAIGAGPSGITRRAYTTEDTEARLLTVSLMEDAGLRTRVDPVGNIFGRIEGRDPKRPVIMAGSHIDTVPNGGMFDGALGVLGAIEAIRAMSDAGIVTESPLEVASFADEEGAWFSGTFGSRAFTSQVREQELRAITRDGQTVWEKMKSAGLAPEQLASTPAAHRIAAYLELHIEQGGVLERDGLDIGIVTGIVGITRGAITVYGMANHSGTTPMHMRDDALVKAARFICLVHEEARRGGDMVATTGQIQVSPGAVNVIPGEARLSLEMRSEDPARIETAIERFKHGAAALGGVELSLGLAKPPVPMDAGIMDCIEEACKDAGYPYKRMPSGAGHDAMCLARIAPVGMIFVPSAGGISHSSKESTPWHQAAKGTDILLRTILKLDARAL
jgi:hydantoinase/carbamoylase family amidase